MHWISFWLNVIAQNGFLQPFLAFFFHAFHAFHAFHELDCFMAPINKQNIVCMLQSERQIYLQSYCFICPNSFIEAKRMHDNFSYQMW